MTRNTSRRVGSGAILLFCAGFYFVSLGLKDVAFHGGESQSARPGGARRLEMRT